jgi:hypothetical protein
MLRRLQSQPGTRAATSKPIKQLEYKRHGLSLLEANIEILKRTFVKQNIADLTCLRSNNLRTPKGACNREKQAWDLMLKCNITYMLLCTKEYYSIVLGKST